ncbi:MAG: 4-(cytidine 5'-diphospho)-2-C-methyl-D-erythritol kinase [Burkholderiales bacterium]
MKRLRCFAPAKLNLFLHITGRRDDGYHLLETVFRFVDFGDTLHLLRRDDGLIVRTQALANVAEEQDLCVRAARLLQQRSGAPFGADIALDKRLPMGGGLGGGSSDAASVLLGLNRLWNLDWSRQQLQDLALELGADVPVFVFGSNAYARGIGEILHAVELPRTWYVVLIPPVQVSTAKIFAHEQLTRSSKAIKITDFSGGGKTLEKLGGAETLDTEKLRRATRNDLQAVVSAEYPPVAECLAWLNLHAEARMTGSGACVFAEFRDEAAAARVFAARPGAMRGFVAQGLDRHPQYDYVV